MVSTKTIAPTPPTNTAAPPVFTPWPAAEHELARKLLHQQCWYFGCDIRHPAGNMLQLYGFTRHRAPDGKAGATSYELPLPPRQRLILWGFGLYFGEKDAEGMFLGRYQFAPHLVDDARITLPLWKKEMLPVVRQPVTHDAQTHAKALLTLALQWIIGYEGWVIGTFGADYRCHCAAEFEHTVLPAHEVIAAWRRLLAFCVEELKC